MAAKKKSSTKKVTITIDQDTLEKFADAAAALSALAAGVVKGADDPALRKQLTKRAKKARKKRG